MTLMHTRAGVIPQSSQRPDVSDEHLIKAAEAYGLELNDCERTVLRGLIRETRPEEPWEDGMRFDIIQAPYRREIGQAIPERHIALNSLLRGLKATFEQPDNK